MKKNDIKINHSKTGRTGLSRGITLFVMITISAMIINNKAILTIFIYIYI